MEVEIFVVGPSMVVVDVNGSAAQVKVEEHNKLLQVSVELFWWHRSRQVTYESNLLGCDAHCDHIVATP